jgi:hypothetical protein
MEGILLANFIDDGRKLEQGGLLLGNAVHEGCRNVERVRSRYPRFALDFSRFWISKRKFGTAFEDER